MTADKHKWRVVDAELTAKVKAVQFSAAIQNGRWEGLHSSPRLGTAVFANHLRLDNFKKEEVDLFRSRGCSHAVPQCKTAAFHAKPPLARNQGARSLNAKLLRSVCSPNVLFVV